MAKRTPKLKGRTSGTPAAAAEILWGKVGYLRALVSKKKWMNTKDIKVVFIISWNPKQAFFDGCLVKQPFFK